jgi:hypothetical protein
MNAILSTTVTPSAALSMSAPWASTGRTQPSVAANPPAPSAASTAAARAHAPRAEPHLEGLTLVLAKLEATCPFVATGDPVLDAIGVGAMGAAQDVSRSEVETDVHRLEKRFDNDKAARERKDYYKQLEEKSFWDQLAGALSIVAEVLGAVASVVTAGASALGSALVAAELVTKSTLSAAVTASVLAAGSAGALRGLGQLGQAFAGRALNDSNLALNRTENHKDEVTQLMQAAKDAVKDHVAREQRVMSALHQVIDLRHHAVRSAMGA